MSTWKVAKKAKSAVVSSLYYLGFFELLRRLQRKRITILMYHRFSEKSEPFKLPRKVFDRQLAYLSRKYSIISFTEYVLVLQKRQDSLPPNPLILTIDDGYQDNYEYAYPVLKKYNVPATIFLTTDFISHKKWLWSNLLEYILKTTNRNFFSFPLGEKEESFVVDSFQGWHRTQLTIFNYCRTISNEDRMHLINELARYLGVHVPNEVTDSFLPLTWDEIRTMQAGGIEYGSHTCSHPIMSRLTPGVLEHELVHSKKEIEQQTSLPVRIFCYPNGQPDDMSKTVIDHVQLSGYSAAVTTVPGFNPPDNCEPYSLRRITVSAAGHVSLMRNLTQYN